MTRNMHKMMLDELRDIYSAETQITKALPKMARKASNPDLKAAFEHHLEETRGQIERLDRVFEMLDTNARARGKKCEAMEGLVSEAKEIMDEDLDADAMDASLVAAAQKVEHYEIAGYGTICAWAKAMGHDDVAKSLAETLEEERATDEKLNKLSAKINKAAAQKAHGEARAA